MKDLLINARKLIANKKKCLSVRGVGPRDVTKLMLQEAVIRCSFDYRNNKTIFSFLERFTDGKTLHQFNDDMEHKAVLKVLDQAIEFLEEQEQSD